MSKVRRQCVPLESTPISKICSASCTILPIALHTSCLQNHAHRGNRCEFENRRVEINFGWNNRARVSYGWNMSSRDMVQRVVIRCEIGSIQFACGERDLLALSNVTYCLDQPFSAGVLHSAGLSHDEQLTRMTSCQR